jgi:hypothetical protein
MVYTVPACGEEVRGPARVGGTLHFLEQRVAVMLPGGVREGTEGTS